MYPNSGDTLNTITKVRLPDGTDVGIVDWQWKPLYSTVELLGGFTDLRLQAFNYGLGDGVTQSSNWAASTQKSATTRDTNVSGVAEMSSTEEMLVYAIGVEVYEYDYAAGVLQTDEAGLPLVRAPILAMLHDRLILELEVSEKIYHQASLGWFPPGFGVASTSPAAATRTYAANSVLSREAIDRSPIPVHIGGTEKYTVSLVNPDGAAVTFYDDAGAADTTAAVRTRINLIGLYKRPVA